MTASIGDRKPSVRWTGVGSANRRRISRLMVGLSYLKHVYDLSDEQVVARWVENPYWQWFCGDEYFQHEAPIDPSLLTRWRQRIGAQGMEKLLAETLRAGLESGALKPSSLERVSVDTTVQPKAIAHPTDALSPTRVWPKSSVALELRTSPRTCV